MLFTGDILLDRGVRQRIEHIGIEHLFSKGIDSLFRQADYVVGNLECPATKTIQPNFKKYVFRAEPEWLSVLREHHVTHLNLANNHSIDQGRAGLVDTWQNIRKAGMTPVGAGNNLEEAIQPVLISNHPRPVWLFASCPTNPVSVRKASTPFVSVSAFYDSHSLTPTSSSVFTGVVNTRSNLFPNNESKLVN